MNQHIGILEAVKKYIVQGDRIDFKETESNKERIENSRSSTTVENGTTCTHRHTHKDRHTHTICFRTTVANLKIISTRES